MRLVRLRAPRGLDNLTLAEAAYPQPGPGEVLVRNRAWHFGKVCLEL